MPLTATGVDDATLAPLPSSPTVPCPQHRMLPESSNAHAAKLPVVIRVALVMPVGVTRLKEGCVVPLPSSPFALAPTHFSSPVDRRTQVSPEPVAIAVTPLAPMTSTGERRRPP